MFKVGDEVRLRGILGVVLGFGSHNRIWVGTANKIDSSTWDIYNEQFKWAHQIKMGGYRYITIGDNTELVLIKSNNTMSSLVEKFKAMRLPEPDKTFVKQGLQGNDGYWTEEGKLMFSSWLKEKFGAEFKKEVVDPIVKESEKKCE